MPVACTKSSISLAGNFPVQSRNLGLYGNRFFSVPFPAFLFACVHDPGFAKSGLEEVIYSLVRCDGCVPLHEGLLGVV
jgi:hypothetical protein